MPLCYNWRLTYYRMAVAIDEITEGFIMANRDVEEHQYESAGAAVEAVSHDAFGDLVGQSGRVYTSLSKSVPKEALALVRLCQTADDKLDTIINTEIDVQHVICRRFDLVEEDSGEVKTVHHTTLITPDLRGYGCYAESIRRAVLLLAEAFGRPPWKQPIRVKIRQVQAGQQGRRYVLDVVETPKAAKGK